MPSSQVVAQWSSGVRWTRWQYARVEREREREREKPASAAGVLIPAVASETCQSESGHGSCGRLRFSDLARWDLTRGD